MGRQVIHNGMIYEDLGNGQARVIGPANQPPMNPEYPYKGPKAAADVKNTSATATRTAVQTQGDLIDNEVKGATAAAIIKKAQAEAAASAAAAEKAQRELAMGGRPQLTAAEFANAVQGYKSAEALTGIIADLEAKYGAGPGATKGVAGFRDFLGGPANQSFDKAANAARGTVGQALGFTGGQLNSAAEAEMNVGPYIPKASDWDSSIEGAIERLKELQRNARDRSVAILGGIPDQNGRITPVQSQFADPRTTPNAMDQTFVTVDPLKAAGAAATEGAVPIPKEMQAEYNAFLGKGLGRFTPDEYATFRAGLDTKYGFPVDQTKLEEYRLEAQTLNKARGRTINARIPPAPRKLSQVDRLRNNAVSSPAGAAAAGFTDSMGFGAVQALAPEQMQALGENHGLAMALGQMGGAVGGTSMLGKLGRETLGRVAPRTLQVGKGAQFGRNLATDTIYGTTYGGVSQGDPLTGAVSGLAGSAGGQIAGKALGKAVGGIDVNPMVQRLQNARIPLTTGQTLGGFAKSIEDAATSIPGVGDMINARRLAGMRAWNHAGFDDAGASVGATTRNLGEQGVADIRGQISTAYDNATAGVSVPVDPRLAADLAAARQAGQRLPGEFPGRVNAAFSNRVDPAIDGGILTGDAYQQAVRGLKGYRAEATRPGFEEDYRDVLGQGIDALTGQMERGGGRSVTDGLAKANEAYRKLKVLQKAVQAAKNGSGSGEIQVFTPAQLNTAATQSANKFGGQRPFADMIDAGQSVLPSQLPDSGTAKRVIQSVIAGGLLGGTAGGGIGAFGDDPGSGALDGATKGLLAGSLLVLGGTKTGQEIINKALTKRSEKLRKAGKTIGRQSRWIGAGSIPLLMDTTR